MKLAPIVLFVYNRLWHTQQTVEALKKNELASVSHLIIYSDGVKDGCSEHEIKLVRQYLRTISGFQTVTVIERKKNMGLANSIIDGVTDIVNKYGKIIVLEDDNVVSPFFIKFMNDALYYYQKERRVMHISAFIHPIDYKGLPEVFFLLPTTCQGGWGTWKRAWDSFDNNIAILDKFTADLKRKFNVNHSYDYYSHLIANKNGKLKTWAIFWYTSVFFAGGLCLHPRQTLVNNIGFDSTGMHCKTSSAYHSDLSGSPVSSWNDNIQESSLGAEKLEEYYKTLKKPLYKRILQKLLP